ncbi:tRNA-dihydrouridine synthase family protein [Barnesiella propionica]|uniref:tRNA-dihydrouridine synthase family protein n=1 Tax=Barnesiella propionica TaxID=2981781 RepID=UPI0011CA8C18|nr:tRNA-dihydrouridine synthase family protein [Barnesiella propionica]MCU6767511.1 tRNA-dihydrouridine synthase family protein [Barnesiella propionica]
MSAPLLSIHFAPLQGYTQAAYRNAHEKTFGSVDYYYSPFIRIEHNEIRHKDIKDVSPENNPTEKLIPQLIASTPDELRRIAHLLSDMGYTRADINMGCPFPLLTRKHKGSGILPYTQEAENLLRTVLEFPEISFSVKMRSGLTEQKESLELLPVLNELPLSHITLHPRLGYQQYKGIPDREAFRTFYKLCSKPLIYNGDILKISDIQALQASFPKLSGVMIGRGLLLNPALALEYRTGKKLSLNEYKKRIYDLHHSVYTKLEQTFEGGEHQLLAHMKVFWEYPAENFDKKAAKRIKKSARTENYLQAVRELFSEDI